MAINMPKGQLLQKSAREEVLRVARHEAGHLIAAKVLGFATNGIGLTILSTTGRHHKGSATIELGENNQGTVKTLEYLRRRVQVLFAGALGEALGGGKLDLAIASQALETNAEDDLNKLCELVWILHNASEPENGQRHNDREAKHFNRLLNELRDCAAILVANEGDHIEEIARRLADKVKLIDTKYELTEEEIMALPEIAARFAQSRLSTTEL